VASADLVLLLNLGGPCPFQDHRIEFFMMQQPSNPDALPDDFDHHVVLFPTRSDAHLARVTATFPAKAAVRPAAGAPLRVKTHAIREVVVLEVAGRLSDVVHDLDRAIQLALAERPRGVVCDLSAVLEGAEPDAVEMLATAGRHVRDWPGIPVAVACPDPLVRAALAAHPLGGHLIVTASMFSAMSTVLTTPILGAEWLRLSPHPTAPRAARDFVTRTLLDWGLGRVIRFASLAVSELVTSSTIHATADIELSVAWHLGALRLTVRDNRPDLRRQPYSHFDPDGRRFSVVAVLSRAFGVLPTADGGKVVWAVLNAARPLPSTSPRRLEPATPRQGSSILTDVSHGALTDFSQGATDAATSAPLPSQIHEVAPLQP
jgi:hypothetical protein